MEAVNQWTFFPKICMWCTCTSSRNPPYTHTPHTHEVSAVISPCSFWLLCWLLWPCTHTTEQYPISLFGSWHTRTSLSKTLSATTGVWQWSLDNWKVLSTFQSQSTRLNKCRNVWPKGLIIERLLYQQALGITICQKSHQSWTVGLQVGKS